MNCLNEYLCERLGVKQQIASAYHPQTNGDVSNSTCCSSFFTFLFASVVNKDQNNWDECIGSVLSGYRASKQESTKASPFSLLYGTKPRLPIELELGSWNWTT